MVWLYLLPVAATLAGLASLAQAAAPQPAAVAGLARGRSWPSATCRCCGSAGFTCRAVCLPLIGALYTAMTISSAWRHRAGRGGEWKGRTIQQLAGQKYREDHGSGTRSALLQQPLKDAYRADPAQALITLRADGELGAESVSCSVATGRALAEAGLHPRRAVTARSPAPATCCCRRSWPAPG